MFTFYDEKIGFQLFDENIGWGQGALRHSWYLNELVPVSWQPEVARCVTVVKSYGGLVSGEEPHIAHLSFSRFLRRNGKTEARTDIGPKSGEEKGGQGDCPDMGEVAGAGASSPHTDEQGIDGVPVDLSTGEEAFAGRASGTSVNKDDDNIKDSNTTNSGAMDGPRSKGYDSGAPSGIGEASFARTDRNEGDPKEDKDRVESSASNAKRKETQPSCSEGGYTHDGLGAKRRRLSSMKWGSREIRRERFSGTVRFFFSDASANGTDMWEVCAYKRCSQFSEKEKVQAEINTKP